jgi:hypothetical protein
LSDSWKSRVSELREASPRTLDSGIVCPFCGSNDIEPMSLFGSQLLTVQLYCNACHTPFEKVKDEAILASFNRG